MSRILKEKTKMSLSISETTQTKVSPLKIIVSSIGGLLMASSFYLMLSQFSPTIKANFKMSLPLIFLWLLLVGFLNLKLKKSRKIILFGFSFLFLLIFLLSFYWTKDAGIQLFNEFLVSIGRFKGHYYFGVDGGNSFHFYLFFFVLTQGLVLLSLLVEHFLYPGILITWITYLIIGSGLLKSINTYSFACLLLATLILLIVEENQLTSKSLKLNSRLLFLISLLIVITLMPLYLLKVDNMVLTSDKINTMQNELKEKKEAHEYGKDTFLPNGQLSQYQENRTDKHVLDVQMELAEPIYLKQFIGKTVEKDNWESLSKESLYDDYPMNYWLNQGSFSSISQLSDSSLANSKKDIMENKMTIKNVSGSSRYLLLPYGVISNSTLENKITNDAFINGEKNQKNVTYTFNFLPNILTKYPDLVKHYSDTKKSDPSNAYLLNEANYNEFVYKNYLSIPDELTGSLTSVSGFSPNLKEHVYYEEADKIIIDYIKKISKKPNKKEKIPDDFVKLSLSNKYTIQYDTEAATLATLLYRHMGIPARYVEGYIITPDAILNAKGNSLAITGKEAHAWTEVYQDGIGWVPKESMATYLKIMPQPEFKGLSLSGNKESDNEATGDGVAKGRQEFNENDHLDPKQIKETNKKQLKDILMIIFTVLLLLILLIGLTIVLVKLIRAYNQRKQIKKTMADEDTLISSKVKLTEIYRLLELDDIKLAGGSLFDYESLIETKYKNKKMTHLYVKVVNDIQKAAYSEEKSISARRVERIDKLLILTNFHVFENKSFKQKLTMRLKLFYS